jgi:hypothetical protein
MLPLVRVDRYRLSLCSNEADEPPHIHVAAGSEEAKFWLAPIGLAANYGLNPQELAEAERIVTSYHGKLLHRWQKHFGAHE